MKRNKKKTARLLIVNYVTDKKLSLEIPVTLANKILPLLFDVRTIQTDIAERETYGDIYIPEKIYFGISIFEW